MGSGGQIEEPVSRRYQPLTEQRSADLEHQLMVVLEAELQDPLDGSHGAVTISQFVQGLAQAGQAILVIRVQGQGLLEAAPGPRELFPSEVRVGGADVELDCMGIKGDAF